MKSFFWGALALAFLPVLAHAQNASTCPAYSRHALTHPAAETAYTINPNDQCKLLVFLNTGAETVTMPVPGAFYPKGWTIKMFASGAGGITLSAATGTQVNGGSTLAKSQNNGADCYNDGTNWWCKP